MLSSRNFNLGEVVEFVWKTILFPRIFVELVNDQSLNGLSLIWIGELL